MLPSLTLQARSTSIPPHQLSSDPELIRYSIISCGCLDLEIELFLGLVCLTDSIDCPFGQALIGFLSLHSFLLDQRINNQSLENEDIDTYLLYCSDKR